MKPVEPSDQWTKIEQKLALLTEENMRLIREREELIADLEECKTELFKRMPPTQISDHTIQKAFERVCRSIEGFVFDNMGGFSADDALYNFCQKKQQSRKRKSRNSLSEFIKRADISAWGPYDCSNVYILSVIIQWILGRYIFREKYPRRITKQQIQS